MQTESDTPPNHVVIGMTVEVALLPEWFDAIREIAGRYVRRMLVVEKPDEWIIKVELHEERVDAFRQALSERWEAFVAERKAAGTWTPTHA